MSLELVLILPCAAEAGRCSSCHSRTHSDAHAVLMNRRPTESQLGYLEAVLHRRGFSIHSPPEQCSAGLNEQAVVCHGSMHS